MTIGNCGAEKCSEEDQIMVDVVKRRMFVRIDLNRFILNASHAGLSLRPEEAAEFLREWGFKLYAGDLWSCDERTVECLRDDEISERIFGVPPELL